ncbi:MAG: DUF6438 domain-containing protein [Bacteroidia bacterium]
MKTLKSKFQKTGIAIFLSLFIIVMAGCSKEESPQPLTGTSAVAGADLRQIGPPPPIARPFVMITIDHQAMRSFLPDYSVTVYSDGTVLFAGRKNVGTLGKVSFSVDQSKLKEVLSVFKQMEFYSIRSDRQINPDVPRTLTSLAESKTSRVKTLVDDNREPGKLVNLRKTVEWVLQIDQYVVKNDFPIWQ